MPFKRLWYGSLFGSTWNMSVPHLKNTPSELIGGIMMMISIALSLVNLDRWLFVQGELWQR
jgi:hypothetical protein